MPGYNIDPQKPDYVTAVITHNAKVHITAINGKDIGAQLKRCSDLPEIMQGRTEDFYIEIISANSASSYGILPPS